MNKTKIEWTDRVWNPITGCSPISEGCRNCYARRMANRLKGRYGYPKDDPFRVTFHSERLTEPLRWKKPSRVFVCSMGDLFHENIPFEMIADIFGPMVIQKHTFLILTKRPKRMAQFLKEEWNKFMCTEWPWPQIWLGVSIEDQKTADERIPILLQIPAAKRFVSVEPMLDDILFYPSWWFPYPKQLGEIPPSGLDWVICGGETGSGARPLHPDWVRSLRDQCQAAGVPFFFKQWGEWSPHTKRLGGGLFLKPDGTLGCQGDWWNKKAQAMIKVGRKKAGHLLDGKEWREFPK